MRSESIKLQTKTEAAGWDLMMKHKAIRVKIKTGISMTERTQENTSSAYCKKSDEDFEDLDEDVYCSIAVTKHM